MNKYDNLIRTCISLSVQASQLNKIVCHEFSEDIDLSNHMAKRMSEVPPMLYRLQNENDFSESEKVLFQVRDSFEKAKEELDQLYGELYILEAEWLGFSSEIREAIRLVNRLLEFKKETDDL